MKVVHITPDYGAPRAYCGHRVQYLSMEQGSGSRDPLVGWAVIGFEFDYHIEQEGEWGFCEDCVGSADYALFLLGEVG